MKNIFKILVITLVFGFFSCEKTEEDYVPPSVVTLKGESISSGGVVLKGDFRNFDKDHEVGFIINNNINPILVNPKEGENTITITKGLYYNQEYYFQAYIKTDTEVFYGLQESFLSTGSALLSLSNLSPNKGNYYDVVEIETDLALEENDRNDIRIYFNNTIAEINAIELNKVTCTVPFFEEDFVSNISFEYFGKKLESSLKFELLKPIISSVSKDDITFGDEITINGENFENGYNTRQKVYIDNIEANIIEKSASTLKIKIPNEVENKNPEIKVLSNLQEVIAEDLITLKNPIITNYPRNVNVLDDIYLIGQNFNPIPGKNTVYFENTEAQILSGDAGQLRVVVPTGVYSNWEPKIRVEVNEDMVSPEYPISILDASIKIKSNIENNVLNFQIINDVIYLYSIDQYNPTKFRIFKYSVDDNSFYDEQVINLPNQIYPFIVKTGGEHIYLYFNRESSNFYRVNLVSGSVEKLSDFPGSKRYMSQVAVNGGNIFLGGGSTNTTYDNIDYVDFYKYDVATNLWEQLTDLVPDKFQPIYFNLYTDDLAYMITGRASNAQEMYKFDGNRFNSLNVSVPNAYTNFIGRRDFFKDGKFYLVQDNPPGYEINKFRVFNTNNNTWSEILDIFPEDYVIIGMFQYGNFVYFETIDYQYVRHLVKLDLNRL